MSIRSLSSFHWLIFSEVNWSKKACVPRGAPRCGLPWEVILICVSSKISFALARKDSLVISHVLEVLGK